MFLFKRSGVFHLQYFDKSENRIRRISTKATRQREALAFLGQFKERLKTQPETRSISMVDFRNEYTAFLRNGHSRDYLCSVETTFRMLNKFLEENHLEVERLQSIDVPTLEQFCGTRFKESPAAASLYYRILKAALSRAMLWSYLAENPVQRVKLPKQKKHLPMFLNESELEVICTNAKTKQLANLFRFAFHTGMRLSEVLNLEWDAIDMKERVIKVSNTETFTTKSKSERVIPINETLFEMLARIQPKVYSIGKNYVFHKPNGQPFTVSYVSHKFKDAARKTGIGEDIHFHSLRHSFASNLVKRGVPIVTVKELLGQTDIKTTMIYSYVRHEDLANAVRMLEGRIELSNGL